MANVVVMSRVLTLLFGSLIALFLLLWTTLGVGGDGDNVCRVDCNGKATGDDKYPAQETRFREKDATGSVKGEDKHSFQPSREEKHTIQSESRCPLDSEDDGWSAERYDAFVVDNVKLKSSLWLEAFGAEGSFLLDNNRSHGAEIFAVSSIRQCRVLGPHAIRYLARYIREHHGQSLSMREKASELSNAGRLIYSCESNKKKHFCGGMGDRFRGIISAFYMALLSNRRFEIYSPVPVPLQKFLKPNFINWVPTALSKEPSGANYDVVKEAVSHIPSDLSMMSIKKHHGYLRRLDAMTIAHENAGEGAQPENAQDLRLQTNSVGIDMFLSKTKTPRLYRNKERLFRGFAPSGPDSGRLSEGFLGHGRKSDYSVVNAPLSDERLNSLNISAYFGCLYEILFSPSEELASAASTVLSGNNEANTSRPQAASIITRINGSVACSGGSGYAHAIDAIGSALAASSDSITKGSSDSREKRIAAVAQNWDRIVIGWPKSRASSRSVLLLKRDFISVQVRVGGALAKGMREPYRTPPEAFSEFYSMIDTLLLASLTVDKNSVMCGGRHKCWHRSSPWDIFVSSDAEAFLKEVIERYDGKFLEDGSCKASGVRSEHSAVNVRYVSGAESFLHTDTLNLGEMDANRWSMTADATKESAYFLTLLNNYLLGLGSHMVMAQSGFGDTAFWRMRREASCLFVDMKGLKIAWQHHLAYAFELDGGAARQSQADLASLGERMCRYSNGGYSRSASEFGTRHLVALVGHQLFSAASVRNRVIDVSRENGKFYN